MSASPLASSSAVRWSTIPGVRRLVPGSVRSTISAFTPESVSAGPILDAASKRRSSPNRSTFWAPVADGMDGPGRPMQPVSARRDTSTSAVAPARFRTPCTAPEVSDRDAPSWAWRAPVDPLLAEEWCELAADDLVHRVAGERGDEEPPLRHLVLREIGKAVRSELLGGDGGAGCQLDRGHDPL